MAHLLGRLWVLQLPRVVRFESRLVLLPLLLCLQDSLCPLAPVAGHEGEYIVTCFFSLRHDDVERWY